MFIGSACLVISVFLKSNIIAVKNCACCGGTDEDQEALKIVDCFVNKSVKPQR